MERKRGMTPPNETAAWLDEEVESARFEGEGGRLLDEPEVRHFCDETWCDLPRHMSHGHDLPSHWSEYVVDSGGALPGETGDSASDVSWDTRISDQRGHA